MILPIKIRRFHFEVFWTKLEGFQDTTKKIHLHTKHRKRKNFIATLAAASKHLSPPLLHSDKALGPNGFTGCFYIILDLIYCHVRGLISLANTFKYQECLETVVFFMSWEMAGAKGLSYHVALIPED
ncbi:hypothetical protein ACJX0J_017147 [Zea mays]